MAEYNLHADAFAKLDEAQLASLERCPLTKLKRYRDGEKLFEVGDRDFKFFVVKSGAVEILDESGETPKIVTILRRGEFTGEVAQLTGGPSIVSGVAQGDCEVFEVSSDALRQLLNDHPRPRRCHPAGLHRPPATTPRVGRLPRRARDRLALTRGTPSGSASSWPRTGCRPPGSTWRTTRRSSNCSRGSA